MHPNPRFVLVVELALPFAEYRSRVTDFSEVAVSSLEVHISTAYQTQLGASGNQSCCRLSH
ncbi:hypothetical protein ANANG_G00032580 [Anguilla anguilla]|uniref:Uncharacterized protein n=1 Tax=Anguilla anguilla TaxID=7936 RepID=A0A9D3S8N1_ANGAN|nr:hypothetical protein ANANG_G00032580 [Anguilla anguilla]